MFLFEKLMRMKKAEKEKVSAIVDNKPVVKVAHCFLLISTEKTDTKDDMLDDTERYSKYKLRHPHRGTAIYKNWIEEKEFIYINGVENSCSLKKEDLMTALEGELKAALTYLHSEEAKKGGFCIRWGYDYAFIQLVIRKVKFNGSERLWNDMPGFRDMIVRLGFEDITDVKSLNKYYNAASGEEFNWSFADNKGRRNTERHRRNLIIQTFTEKMREIRGM